MRRFLTILLLFAGIFCHAQTQADLYSFKVMYPQGTVTQGDWINVVYFLEALNYSVKDVETVEGLQLESIQRDKRVLNNGFDLVTTTCRYTVVGVGEIPLPKLEAYVNGKPVTTNPVVLDVQPNPKYGREWQAGKDFLISKGVKPDHLVVRHTSETLAAFSDNVEKAFVIVARTDYASFLESPILAYGIGNSMWDGTSSESENSVQHILTQYNILLKLLKSKGETYHSLPLSLYMDNPTGVKPLLGGINYGQRSPYNAFFPKGKYQDKDSTCMVGCGPVALAQVLAYYGYPDKPVGRGFLNLPSGKQTVVQMKDAPFSWDGSAKGNAALMLCAAASVKAKIGPTKSESSLADFTSALINNWGYSPKCVYMLKQPDMTMLEQIYGDLKEGRPVIAADASHIFVIDGFDGDFLHLNLGWEGYCNGYYKMIVVQSDTRRQLPFSELIGGIKPFGQDEAYEVKIKLSKPATLEKELSKLKDGRKMEDITSIKLSGKINGWDIALLRKLAGADPEFHGSLMDIDLSEAILTHGGRYAVRDASKMVFSGSTPVPYRFDMARITQQEWSQMQSMGLSQGPTWLIEPNPAGGFIVNWYEENDTIGPYMFSDCQTLRSIVLPNNLKEIMGNAFAGSRAIQSVTGIPRKVAPDAFDNSSLEGRVY